MKQEWTMWFQDGGGRQLILGEQKLRSLADRYSFDADEVLLHGETEFLDEDGTVVGGVFQEGGRS